MNLRTPASLSLLLSTAVGLGLASPSLVRAQGVPQVLIDQVHGQRSLLRQGSRGPAVEALQRTLSNLGFTLRADGDFGPLTAGQVRAFQRSQGLSADGVVGPQTLRALQQAVGGATPATPPPRSGSGNPGAGSPSSGSPSGGIIAGLGGTGSARGGTAIAGQLSEANSAGREAAILAQVVGGATPRFLDSFQKVTIRGRDAAGRDHVLEVWVSPDYLSLGNDADPVRVPLRPATAQRICDRLRCLLPTRKLVNAIYGQAAVKLRPQPLPPGAAMTTASYFLRHNLRIEEQLRAQGAHRGALIAGHKKDVVISPRLQQRPGRVAIYGWHRSSGNPIQPLSTVHGRDYVDYSHGVRLVRDAVRLDGRPHSAAAILKDRTLYPLLSDEGRFTSTRAD
jgi:peptidoglycan hydrolase-like protein with peptidoglycan-binding domain